MSLPTFETKEEAFDWMEQEVDDPYQDNERFAFKDDESAMLKYEQSEANGCCGFFDDLVIVDGREAFIGCNYGH